MIFVPSTPCTHDTVKQLRKNNPWTLVHLNQVILAPPQCGTASSCVKISRPTNMFDDWGRFVPRDQRRPPETLFRGCFVLDLKQDICHNARDGLRYCWCSSKDLCNSSTSIGAQVMLLIFCYIVGEVFRT